MSDAFEPTLDAAHGRIAAVRPAAYARSRNRLDGAVTGLSPYITHRLVTLTDVLTEVAARQPMLIHDKFVYELGWRAYVRQGNTGVPVVDQAVPALYTTGMLHNHARMWLASYLVHPRKVHWRAGADWLYGHLLDGDLASNHLSWQWVAGTDSAADLLAR